jgi:hypothetical protein
MPVIESTIMMPSLSRICFQSCTRCRQENGRMIRKARNQRRYDSVAGGMWPAASLPATALPAQHAAVMESSKYGWLAIQRIGETFARVSVADIHGPGSYRRGPPGRYSGPESSPGECQ